LYSISPKINWEGDHELETMQNADPLI
jgi:hypothetical protein